jgi:hypothetical protein
MGSFEGQNQAENQPVPVEQCADRFKKLRRDVALGRFEDIEKRPVTSAEKQIEMNIHLERRKSPPADLTKPLADNRRIENEGWLREWEKNQEEKQEHDHN